MSCTFATETFFGPVVSSCRREFDFTLSFEEIFFKLTPACLLLVLAGTRVFVLARRPAKGSLGVLYVLKLCTLALFAIFELVTLVAIRVHDGTTRASVPSAALSFVAALALIATSHYEHTRSWCPSFLLVFFLFVTALLRSAMTRTYWLIDGYHTIASVSLTALVIQLALLVLESWTKRVNANNEDQKVPAEETAGFVSRSLFLWLNGIFWIGYHRSLSAVDLRPTDGLLNASHLSQRFGNIMRGAPLGYFGLPGRTLRHLGPYLVFPVIPRFCLTGFTFAQPFLASSLMDYLRDTNSYSKNDGYGLIGASLLVYGGIAISNSWYWHLAYKAATMVRGGLVEIIFDKTLKLREDKNNESKTLTLMVSDAQRINSALQLMHELWAGPLETGLATWLLWRKVGPSSLTILGMALACTVISTVISKYTGSQQQKWLAATEKRIAATKRMLSSLKAIKMTGTGKRARATIEVFRRMEFAASKMFRTLLVAAVLSSYTTLTLSPVLVFGTYIGVTMTSNGDLDASRLFTSLILINLLASPLIHILQLLPSFGAAKGCFARLRAFLEKSELIDYRQTQPGRRQDPDSPKDQALKDDKFLQETGSAECPDDIALAVEKAQFGWTTDPFLNEITLEIRKGEHVAITGPVGCGKSLLLKAILGEVECISGSVRVGTSRIGYCGQETWLENITVLENAFRCAPEDVPWRQKVVDSCALNDLARSQSPSETIGSNGTKISGGERQRLALARTIASRPDIILLDDVFSAVDRNTARLIQESLLGRNGILRQMGVTVIQTVQDRHSATMSDKLFKIDDGRLHSCEVPENPARRENGTVNGESSDPKPGIPFNGGDRQELKTAARMADKAVYRTYFGSIGPANMAIFFILAIAFSFCIKFPDLWARWWSEANASGSSRGIGFWLGLYAMLQTLPLIVLCIWLGHLLLKIVPTSGVGLHRKLLTTVLGATFSFVSNIDSGDVINRFNQDLMLVDAELPIHLLNTVSEFFISIMQVVLIAVAALYVLALLPAIAIALFLIQHFYLRTSKQLRQLDLQSKSSLHTKFIEASTGLLTIRAHGWQGTMREEFGEKLDRSQEPLYLLAIVQLWLQLTLNLLVTGLSITVAGFAVGIRDKTNVGAIGVAFLNMTTLGERMTRFITSWTSLEVAIGAIARIQAFEKDTPEETDPESPVNVAAKWPESGTIRFDNVWASYDTFPDKTDWSLRGVSFQIRSGEKIAICGRTGSGKSTLLVSLLALIEAKEGAIAVDDVDISRVERSILRSRFDVISQDTFSQGETVRGALDPEGRFSDEAITEILEDCAMLHKIESSGGFSTKVVEISFSAGEAQLFALARTILGAQYRQSGIVLLDEATSSVDTVTEKKVMKLIKQRLQGKTIVSVLHRLETALEYDRILVMEEGEVIHFGTPSEVMQDSDLFLSLRVSG